MFQIYFRITHCLRDLFYGFSKFSCIFRLYSALNESDVVNGILQEKVSCSTSSVMKEGLAQEQAGNVAAAMETYKKGLKNFGQQTTKSYDEHFITEAFFKVRYCTGIIKVESCS